MLLAAAALAAAPLSAQSTAAPVVTEMLGGHRVVSHRVLFAFKTVPSASAITEIKAMTGAVDLRPVGGAGAYLIDSSTLDTADLIAYLSSRLDIAYAEPDDVMTIAQAGAPNDPQFPSQWGLDNTGQRVGGVTGTPGADVNAPGAWQVTTGSRSVVVALMDTGVQYDHPDLAANIWSAPAAFSISVGGVSFNCPAGDHGLGVVASDFGCDPADYQDSASLAHGTGNAGIIGAVGNNGVGVAGVNWQVSVMPLKTCEDTSEGVGCPESDVIDALQAAIDLKQVFGAQADVVAANFSFDGDSFDDDSLKDEMVLAGDNGITIAVATGDDGGSGAEAPASFYLANEIAVSAFSSRDIPSQWSGGKCSNGGGDVAAPGTSVLTTATGSGYYYADGTSASAPFVAGAVALVASACPLTPKMMVGDITGTADEIANLDSISWDGKRLDLASAVTGCTTGTPGTGQIEISGGDCEGCYGYPEVPSSGAITVDIGLGQYRYDWNADDGETSAELAEAIASDINSDPFRVVNAEVTSASPDDATVSITSIAKGPWTAFATNATNTDTCTPPYEGSCAPDPWYVSISYAGGSRP